MEIQNTTMKEVSLLVLLEGLLRREQNNFKSTFVASWLHFFLSTYAHNAIKLSL